MIVMDIFISICVLAIVVVAVVNSFYSSRYKVVNMPSAPQTRRKIIKDIKTFLSDRENSVIYDLGSGWGGLCHRLSKNFPNTKVIGIEISLIPYLYSKMIALLFSRAYTIRRENLFHTDLTDADIIVCYLSPYHMKRFETEIYPILRKGCRIYSQGFPMNNIENFRTIKTPFSLEKAIYCYQKN